jgi:hypothetical protein
MGSEANHLANSCQSEAMVLSKLPLAQDALGEGCLLLLAAIVICFQATVITPFKTFFWAKNYEIENIEHICKNICSTAQRFCTPCMPWTLYCNNVYANFLDNYFCCVSNVTYLNTYGAIGPILTVEAGQEIFRFLCPGRRNGVF